MGEGAVGVVAAERAEAAHVGGPGAGVSEGGSRSGVCTGSCVGHHQPIGGWWPTLKNFFLINSCCYNLNFKILVVVRFLINFVFRLRTSFRLSTILSSIHHSSCIYLTTKISLCRMDNFFFCQEPVDNLGINK